jgi:adenylate cyclase
MPQQRDATPLSARARLPLAMGLAALLVLLGGAGWWLVNATRHSAIASQAPAEAGRLSIVVLPFVNLSGDPAKDYLVDALTDELTTSLARIHGTFVIARNTAFAYKDKPVDAKAIGKDLGVRYVLEGSVQFIDAQARVNAQLIDAGSGAHLWAEQFDTKRADLLQMQDEIVVRLAREMELTLTTAEATRLKRAPANPDAEDLALQCDAAVQKAGFVGKEGYPLCEQALSIDPDNVRALKVFAIKYYMPVNLGTSADPKADLKRVDELLAKGLAIDPTFAAAHNLKAWMLTSETRFDEAIAERERALALDPASAGAMQGLGWDYLLLGQFEKGLEIFDKAIRLSPRDPELHFVYAGESWAYFALTRYDRAMDWARRAIAVNPRFQHSHAHLVAALALSGREAEAREALQSYLALPSSERLRTIAAWKRHYAQSINSNTDPRVLESYERETEGLRKAGMPEE